MARPGPARLETCAGKGGRDGVGPPTSTIPRQLERRADAIVIAVSSPEDQLRSYTGRTNVYAIADVTRGGGHFVGALRRELLRVLLAQCGAGNEDSSEPESRPDGNDVEAMVSLHPELFRAGEVSLPACSHR